MNAISLIIGMILALAGWWIFPFSYFDPISAQIIGGIIGICAGAIGLVAGDNI